MPDINPADIRTQLVGLTPEQQHQFLDELERRHADFTDVQGGSSTANVEPKHHTMGYPEPGDYLNALTGAGRSAANTAIGLGALPLRAAAALGADSVKPAVAIADEAHKDLAPRNTAEEIGQGVEQAAEIMIPAAKLAKLTKGAGFAARLAANAGLSGATAGAEGGDLPSAGLGAATGAFGETLGTLLPSALRSSAVKNWFKVVQDSRMNPFQKAALRDALSIAADELPVGTKSQLATKLAAKTEQTGQAVADVFKPLENTPMSLSEPIQSLKSEISSPVTKQVKPGVSGRTIRKEIRFADLDPQAQDALLAHASQGVPGAPSFAQMSPAEQAALRAQALQENPLIKPEILKNPNYVRELRDVTGRLRDLSSPTPSVSQVRGFRQGLGEEAEKALTLGTATDKSDALTRAYGETTGAIHKQFPQTQKADATHHIWKQIDTQMQKAFDVSGESTTNVAKYFAAKAGLSLGAGAIAGATASASGETPLKSTAIGLGAAYLVSIRNGAVYNSMSAATKNSIARMLESGDEIGAAKAIKAAAIILENKLRANRKLITQEQIKQRQRTGVMVE